MGYLEVKALLNLGVGGYPDVHQSTHNQQAIPACTGCVIVTLDVYGSIEFPCMWHRSCILPTPSWGGKFCKVPSFMAGVRPHG